MIKAFLTDPGFALTVRWALALVFVLAAIHKLKSPAAFRTTMKNYRVVPERLLTPVSYSIIGLELLAAAALLANSHFGSGIAAGLLVIYTSSISINLIRGRRDIDCGCSGPAIRQTLSAWLVARNIAFLSAALLTLPASIPRPLSLLDWYTTCAAVISFTLIYFAASYLSASKARFGS